MVIPRTIIFIRQGDRYLLLKGAPDKRLWAGLYNGIGGHIERGEDVLTAAHRELLEETGLVADLWLCGTVIVDTGQSPGVCLFVFCGELGDGKPVHSDEGEPRWISPDDLRSYPVVEDLPDLLERVRSMQPGDNPFAARSYYDDQGRLVIEFL
jgi:8-oxo-dGTP diphosphatase